MHRELWAMLLWACVGQVVVADSCSWKRSSQEENQPNILFIYADDLGWRDLSFRHDQNQREHLLGSDFYATPNLDALAARGVVFTQAYAAAANCAPSRASLMTGQYTTRHKIYNVGTSLRGLPTHSRLKHVAGSSELRPGTVTWATCLRQAGYRTGLIGKWHLGTNPRDFGFEETIVGTSHGGQPNGYFDDPKAEAGAANETRGEYLTDRLTNEAIQFIDRAGDQPWCLFLSHFAVHTPLQGKPELVEKYRQQPAGELHDSPQMAAMIESLDQGVGRVLAKLQEQDLLDRTIIVFSSDNGGYGPATSMDPLRGYKGTYFEGGIRVPLFVVWPGVTQPGRICTEPVTQLDIFPTLCQLSNSEIPESATIDGQSWLPLMRKSIPWPSRALFWHFPAYLESYRQRIDGQRDPLFRSRPCSVIREGRWKLIHYFEDQTSRLYDIELDPSESIDWSVRRRDVTKNLLGKLELWQTETGADLPSTLNPEYSAASDVNAQLELFRRDQLRMPLGQFQQATGQLPAAKRILFLGDSITYSGHYVSLLEAAIRKQHPDRTVELLNLGLPSETVSGLSEPGHAGGQFPRPDLHERLTRVLDQIQPDLVVACYGMNDGIYHPLSDERFAAYRNGIERLRREVEQRGCELQLLTPAMFDAQPLGDRLLPAGLESYPQPYRDYDGVLRTYADWLLMQRADDRVVLDIHQAMRDAVTKQRLSDPTFTLAPDGVHPTPGGHEVIARVIAKAWDLDLSPFLDPSNSDSSAILQLVSQKQELMKHAWLTKTGHQRPGISEGTDILSAELRAANLTKQIRQLCQ
ncbi:MAG: sulfatase-like hydrolase/transferase [Pirellulaceae bacterium]|nr:sulfatase-like hydrolase/transferase [Pirellulaceae bacterium]